MVMGVPCTPWLGVTPRTPMVFAAVKLGATGPGSAGTPGRLLGAVNVMGLTVSALLPDGLTSRARGRTAALAAHSQRRPRPLLMVRIMRTPFTPTGVDLLAAEDFSFATLSPQARASPYLTPLGLVKVQPLLWVLQGIPCCVDHTGAATMVTCEGEASAPLPVAAPFSMYA